MATLIPGTGTQDQYGYATNVPTQATQPGTTTPYTGYTASPYPATVTTTPAPTVISNQTKKDQVDTMSKSLDGLSQNQGIRTDAQGNANYANGTIYQSPQPQEQPEVKESFTQEVTYTGADGVERNRDTGQPAKVPPTAKIDATGAFVDPTTGKKYNAPSGDTSSLDKQSQEIADEIKSRADVETATMIDNIKSKMGRLIAQQEQYNAASNAQTQNALLMGGVTGQGSSSQYAPISSANLVSATVNYGLQKVADLVSQEQQLISEAEAARYQKNYPDLEKKLALIADKKAETQAEAKKISDTLSVESKKKNESNMQSVIDNAVVDEFISSKGQATTAEILKTLQSKGLSATIENVNKTLQTIATAKGTDVTGMTTDAKEFYKLRDEGQIPDSILALPNDTEQLNAYLQNKAIAKKAPANSKSTSTKGVTTSGTLKYTSVDEAEDSKALEASRGADTYVDPAIYEKLYKAWVANGGLLKDFLTKFPPKNYVNPANDWLPMFLRPTATKTTKTTTSTANTTSGGRER